MVYQARGSQIVGRCKQFGGVANTLGGPFFKKISNQICIGNVGAPSNILILYAQTIDQNLRISLIWRLTCIYLLKGAHLLHGQP